jgi:hypothetical protein
MPRPCPFGHKSCPPGPVNAAQVPEGMDAPSYIAGWAACGELYYAQLQELADSIQPSDPLHALKPKKGERP